VRARKAKFSQAKKNIKKSEMRNERKRQLSESQLTQMKERQNKLGTGSLEIERQAERIETTSEN
jgi:hypothetical protein